MLLVTNPGAPGDPAEYLGGFQKAKADFIDMIHKTDCEYIDELNLENHTNFTALRVLKKFLKRVRTNEKHNNFLIVHMGHGLKISGGHRTLDAFLGYSDYENELDAMSLQGTTGDFVCDNCYGEYFLHQHLEKTHNGWQLTVANDASEGVSYDAPGYLYLTERMRLSTPSKDMPGCWPELPYAPRPNQGLISVEAGMDTPLEVMYAGPLNHEEERRKKLMRKDVKTLKALEKKEKLRLQSGYPARRNQI